MIRSNYGNFSVCHNVLLWLTPFFHLYTFPIIRCMLQLKLKKHTIKFKNTQTGNTIKTKGLGLV